MNLHLNNKESNLNCLILRNLRKCLKGIGDRKVRISRQEIYHQEIYLQEIYLQEIKSLKDLLASI